MKTKVLMIALAVILFSNAQAQVPSYVPTNGLVGWWPFNGNANDESGNGNNGVVNGPTLTNDRFGVANKAYNFDGVNDLINCGNGTTLNLFLSEISVSAWVKSSPLISTDKNIVSKYGCNPGGWSLESAQNTLVSNFTGCGQNVTNQNNINTGLWTHILGIKQGNNWKIYVNGILNNTSPGTLNYNLNSGFDMIIGVQNDNLNPTTYWDGQIDDIGIWDRALTQQEITNLYNSSAYVPCASPAFPANLANGLVGYWPFCGDANDESGNGNNGTVNGATLTSDRFGNPNSAYVFDGVGASIYTSASFSPGNSAKSLSVWAKLSDLSNRGWMISNNTCINGSNYDGFGFYQEGPTNKIYFYGMTSGDRLVSYQFDTSSYFHFVASYQQDTLKVYVNSILCSITYNPLNTLSTNGVLFGDRFSGLLSGPCGNDNLDGGYFKGVLDDIGIWNRALSASEVQQLYNTGVYFQTVTGSCDTLQFNANITGFNPVTYQNQVKVFPNPAKDNLVIDCGANYNTLNGYSIRIVNTLSQTVYNSPITQQITNIQLIAPTWSNGAYVVQFINPSGTVIEAKQIIIQ